MAHARRSKRIKVWRKNANKKFKFLLHQKEVQKDEVVIFNIDVKSLMHIKVDECSSALLRETFSCYSTVY